MHERSTSHFPHRNVAALLVAALATFAALLPTAPHADADHEVRTERIVGEDRYGTAAEIARLLHPDGAEVAIVANGHRFADALAAAALSRAVDGPVLLTQRDAVPAATEDALRTLGATRVIILGGLAAVGPLVEVSLRTSVGDVHRILGIDRFDTAARVAREIDAAADASIGSIEGERTALLVNAYSFPDAVAAGPLAASGGDPFPIVMTERDRLHPLTREVLDELAIDRVLIVGGLAGVSDEVASSLRDSGRRTIRIAGADRGKTSTRVAEYGESIAVFDTQRVHLARGDDPADALAAGPLAGSSGSPMLLTASSNQLGSAVSEWLRLECPGVSAIRAVGGQAAMAASVIDAAAQQGRRCHGDVPPDLEAQGVSWVAPWGSDSAPGTSAAPYRTIGHGMRALQPGETLVVRGGTYRERIEISFTTIPRGRPDAPITVQAYPGERPVIEGRLRLSGADHWTIRGINVTWSENNASNEHMVHFRGGSNWRFTDAEVWGAKSFSAILVNDGARDFQLDHLYVHHTHPTNGLNQDHLLYIAEGNTGGLIERNVLAHSPNGRGVKVGPGSLSQPGSDWLTIRYNTFYANTGPSNLRFSGSSSNNEAYGNLLVRSGANSAAITSYELTGTGNVAHDNAAWDATGVVEPEEGLRDGGGNVMVDPAFADPANGDFRPTNPEAAEYGAHAPAGAHEG